MADLRALCRDRAIGPDQLWRWPTVRLARVLAWPSHCWRAVDRYKREQGVEPDLDVPACVLLPGDPAWPCCLDDVDSPPSGLHVEGDRSLLRHLNARTAIAVVGTRSASDHGLAMAEELGRALAEAGWPVPGLPKGLMLQRIVAVWPGTELPSQFWGHHWIVCIPLITDRCNVRLPSMGCCCPPTGRVAGFNQDILRLGIVGW